MKKDKTPGNDPHPLKIEYHADDFGLFPEQSKRIMECYTNGRLNGISIFPNSPYLDACMKMLRPVLSEVAITVHLNFMEGRSMNKPWIGLTDADGTLRLSFGKILIQSFLPGQKNYRLWLKEEIRRQIRSVAQYLPEGTPLRLDGHAHYHMLPMIFDAMIEVIQEERWNVSYIRIPREYPMLYLRHIRKMKDFAPINMVKVLILNLLAARNQRKHGAFLNTLEKKVFMGVLLSGRMYRENVMPILPDAVALAEKLGQGLEILAHPGGVYEEMDVARLTSRDDVEFLTSYMRLKEATLYQN